MKRFLTILFMLLLSMPAWAGSGTIKFRNTYITETQATTNKSIRRPVVGIASDQKRHGVFEFSTDGELWDSLQSSICDSALVQLDVYSLSGTFNTADSIECQVMLGNTNYLDMTWNARYYFEGTPIAWNTAGCLGAGNDYYSGITVKIPCNGWTSSTNPTINIQPIIDALRYDSSVSTVSRGEIILKPIGFSNGDTIVFVKYGDLSGIEPCIYLGWSESGIPDNGRCSGNEWLSGQEIYDVATITAPSYNTLLDSVDIYLNVNNTPGDSFWPLAYNHTATDSSLLETGSKYISPAGTTCAWHTMYFSGTKTLVANQRYYIGFIVQNDGSSAYRTCITGLSGTGDTIRFGTAYPAPDPVPDGIVNDYAPCIRVYLTVPGVGTTVISNCIHSPDGPGLVQSVSGGSKLAHP